MEKEILYIRADGNKVLGMGHLMRCFVIAGEWERQGGICRFLVADEDSKKIVGEHGFDSVVLYSDWRNLDKEIEKITAWIQEQGTRLILLDSYYFTQKYIKELKRHCAVAYMGDKADAAYPVDLLINYNIYAGEMGYESIYSHTDTRLLLGTQYFPLRKEFKGEGIVHRAEAEKVFLTTGGTDPLGILEETAKRLLESGFLVEAVAGRFHPRLEELKKLQQENPAFRLYVNVKNMAERIGGCDIAVSAAGITLYELSAMGIPTVTFSFVDNQVQGAETMGKKGIMEYVGDMREDMQGKITSVTEKVVTLSDSIQRRNELSEKMRRLVDGEGAGRIVKELLVLYHRIL